MSKTREYFKFNFSKVVKFDCTCGRRYINTDKCLQETDSRMPQTRADVIRSMNDEELAEFLLSVNTSYEDSCVTNCKWEDYPTRDKGCKDCFLEYLRKEAE